MSGKVFPPESMFLRMHVGEASSDGNGYEMSTHVGQGVPIVHSKQTGKWFTLSWEDILDLARAAGIDE